MTDLLERLRAADPVDRDGLVVPDTVRARLAGRSSARPARALRVAAAGLVAAGVAAVLVLVLGMRPGPRDLASRAYAATTGPGVIHWRTEVLSFSNGRFFDHQRIEGWARGSTTRFTVSTVRRGRSRLIFETRVSGRRAQTYRASEDDYLSAPAPPRGSTNSMQLGDPIATFRRAFRAGKLLPAGPNRYATELPGPEPRIRLTYEFDPATARPIRLTIPSSTVSADGRRYENRTEMRFAVYERLPATAANVAKLALAPHPGAGPKDIDAVAFFRVLRDGAPPGPAAAKRLRRLATSSPEMRRFALRPEDARRLTGAFFLVPGHGYLCVTTVSGGGCATIDQVLRRGVWVGSTRGPRVIAVPDGVRALRVRVRGGRRTTVAVHGNAATLPPGTFATTFIRRR